MSPILRRRLTIRARLTLVYGGLFLSAGAVLLVLTYGLLAERLPGKSGSLLVQKVLPSSVVTSPTHGLATSAAPSPSQTTGQGGLLGLQGSISTRGDALSALVTDGSITLVAVGVAAIALGWLIAGRLLQPLQLMTETARRIADAPAAHNGLHERIALDGPPDELKELADTFDAMIERLDSSFAGQRTFVANASHELRTPLTLNRALLEVAVHRRSASPEMLQLGETLLEINARHERLIEGLLLLASSEPQVTERSFVDLADIVEHVVSQGPTGPPLVEVGTAEAPTTGNPVLLERLVQNLFENAVRHNVAAGWVRIATRTTPAGLAELVVSNTGPVIPKYEVPALFEPFHRFGADRLVSPGAGLGLSIVQSVARAHGGEVAAEARDGGGLVVTVTLPGAPSVE